MPMRYYVFSRIPPKIYGLALKNAACKNITERKLV